MWPFKPRKVVVEYAGSQKEIEHLLTILKTNAELESALRQLIAVSDMFSDYNKGVVAGNFSSKEAALLHELSEGFLAIRRQFKEVKLKCKHEQQEKSNSPDPMLPGQWLWRCTDCGKLEHDF